MRAEIIAIGSELLTPDRLDTNSLFLTAELNQVGIRVTHKTVVGDAPDEMRSSFRDALDRAELIVSCGGLGPTDDDRTRETVAGLLGRKLHSRRRDPARASRSAFAATAAPCPQSTSARPWFPKARPSCRIRAARRRACGSKRDGHIVILLPGVPAELRALVETEVKPRLAKLGSNGGSYSRELRILGLPESEVEQRVSPLYALYPDIETTILAAPTGIQLHPRIWSERPGKSGKAARRNHRAHGAGARRTSLFHARRTAGRNLRAHADRKSRHHRRRRKLHRRHARRAAHKHPRKLPFISSAAWSATATN